MSDSALSSVWQAEALLRASPGAQGVSTSELIAALDRVLADHPSSPWLPRFQEYHRPSQPSSAEPQVADEPAHQVMRQHFIEIGALAQRAYNAITEPAHRKRYGQFFTPGTIAAVACAAAIHAADASVIDPMCGLGAMVWAAADRRAFLGQISPRQIVGVELDPLAARFALFPGQPYRIGNAGGISILRADAFLYASGLFGPVCERTRFHAVVGNPPYIRYQNLAALLQHIPSPVLSAFREQLPNATPSSLAATIIRACLVSHLVASKDSHDRFARDTVALLHSREAPKQLDELDRVWWRIVSGYSGLADLSLPAWLLTWRLVEPGGYVAYVTTDSWRNREYARVLRYFMLRMFRPVLIVEQEGHSWFNAAQVATSLVVLQALPSREAVIPLSDRASDGHIIKAVRLKRDYNLAAPEALIRIAGRLGCSEPAASLAQCAHTILELISAQQQPLDNECWSIDVASEQPMATALLQEDSSAQRSGTTRISLRDLEGRPGLTPVTSSRDSSVSIPNEIKKALSISAIPETAFCILRDYEASANQGLRTGCNPFFYVHVLTIGEIHELFLPLFKPAAVMEILSDPAGHPVQFTTLVETLHTHGALIPAPTSSEHPPARIVRLSKEFGGKLSVFPAAMLCPVVRYQSRLTHYAVTNPDNLTDHALVIDGAVHPQDYQRLTSYPLRWLQTWQTRDNLAIIPEPLAAYIQAASVTRLVCKGNPVPIPLLSAVAPNIYEPPLPNQYTLLAQDVPRAPRWWYTLPILPRHTGELFIPRVNASSPCAYLNNRESPVLIDANFSTLSLTRAQLPVEALFALLNSVWAKACLETIATPMGGGALKVEAAHLRILPLPRLGTDSITKLQSIGAELARLPTSDSASSLFHQIDAVVVDYLATVLGLDKARVLGSLCSLAKHLAVSRTMRNK